MASFPPDLTAPANANSSGAPASGNSDPASHGRLMDSVYARQRHIYDVSRKYYLLGRDPLIAGLDVPPGGSVLEIACGTGRNLILAARAYPDAKLYGFDISAEMLTTARSSIEKAGLSSRIQLAQGNAEAFDPMELFGIGEIQSGVFFLTACR